ncbi:hypothetical protein ACFXKG_33590 [Streptomyces sp. NPDC059255]|uniref:hypothetical protein n=1 Tax=Streptomyces sp. NPDC059255 TaxID=3346793 RepID=UPI00369E19B9
MPVKVPLEETAFNADRIAPVGRELHSVRPEFGIASLVGEVAAEPPRLESKERIARTGQSLDARARLTRSPAGLAATVTIATPPVPQLEDVMHPARAYQPPGTERRFSAIPHRVGSVIRSATPDTGWAA